MAMSENFVAAAIDEIWRLGIAVLRWHDVGDFFSLAYVMAVREIVRATYTLPTTVTPDVEYSRTSPGPG